MTSFCLDTYDVVAWASLCFVWRDIKEGRGNDCLNSMINLRYNFVILLLKWTRENRLNVDAIVWATISSVVLWNIWICQCQNVFQQIRQNLVHCVKEIWSMLISILKGQYDSFTGTEDMIFLKQQSFKGEWKDLLVFVERNDKMD